MMVRAHFIAAELSTAVCTLSNSSQLGHLPYTADHTTRQIWDGVLLDVDTDIVFRHNAEYLHLPSDHVDDVDGHVTHVENSASYFAQDSRHSGFVSLDDIELDNTIGVLVTPTQPLQPLFEGGDVQDEDGSTNFWSPHGVPTDQDAAVNYTHVELPDFGPWMQDAELIHAGPIEQPEDYLQISMSQRSPYRNPSASTECQSLRKIVRRWLSDHASRPYPSRIEKKTLTESAGCSVEQLEICFRNMRAREKHCKLVEPYFYCLSDNAPSI